LRGKLANLVLSHATEQNAEGNDRPTLYWGYKAQGTCGFAEHTFAMAARQISAQVAGEPIEPQPGTQAILSVYHDADSTPILLRKSSEENTALTLRPIDLQSEYGGDLSLPAGMIVSVVETGAPSQVRQALTGQYAPEQQPGATFTSHELDPLAFGLCPQRLSPWAFASSDDASLFAIKHVNRLGGICTAPAFSQRRWDTYGDVSIADFRQGATSLLALCGISADAAQPL
jgi:hypothetical protein